MNSSNNKIHNALSYLSLGDVEKAQDIFINILEQQPTEINATIGYAECLRAKNKTRDAILFLHQHMTNCLDVPDFLIVLGLCYIDEQRFEESRSVFEQVLVIDKYAFVARLYLGYIFEQFSHNENALVMYFRAILDAQRQGYWINDKTTAPWLREKVKHAINAVFEGRRKLFFDVILPLESQFGRAALERVKICLRNYLGMLQVSSLDYRQKPTFMYFPGLPATPYFDTSAFQWIESLESKTNVIREELCSVLDVGEGVEAFHQHAAPNELKHLVQGVHGASAWNAFFFYRNGKAIEANIKKCPETVKAINATPMVKIRAHAPEICFSLLSPGGHIMPHRGITNTRLVLHLPLIVPENCALNITGVGQHEWKVGRAMVFDDTYEHEAWNRSNDRRIILLSDIWNPHLTDVERLAITSLVEAIGDFNAACRNL